VEQASLPVIARFLILVCSGPVPAGFFTLRVDLWRKQQTRALHRQAGAKFSKALINFGE